MITITWFGLVSISRRVAGAATIFGGRVFAEIFLWLSILMSQGLSPDVVMVLRKGMS